MFAHPNGRLVARSLEVCDLISFNGLMKIMSLILFPEQHIHYEAGHIAMIGNLEYKLCYLCVGKSRLTFLPMFPADVFSFQLVTQVIMNILMWSMIILEHLSV